jgi:hypothetical protein
LLISSRFGNKHGLHRKFLFLIGRFFKNVLSNCLAKWTETHSVCHFYSPQKCKIYTSDWNSFGLNIGGWAGEYNIRSTNFCRITTCKERCINRVHLTFSLYTNCQNRPCGKEFNTTAFVNLLICNVNVNIIMWRNLNIVSKKLFPQSDLLRYQRV